MNLDDIQRTGIVAIYKSADILHFYLGNIPEIKKKGAIDLVTQADIESEKKYIEIIGSVFPDHGILAEESGKSNENHEYVWIIYPLDGTTNFAHHMRIFSTSIAFSYKGEIVFGVINNPVSQELFSVVKRKGAFLNNCPIHVSETDSVSESLLVTGFTYNFKDHDPVCKMY